MYMKNLILIIGASLLTPVPALAQEVPQPAEAPSQTPYQQLYSVFEAGVNNAAINDGMVEAMKGMFAKDPVMSAMNELNPGLIDAVAESTRPVLGEYSERVRIAYRPRMVAILESELTTAETAEIIDFYTSPIGQKVMGLVSNNYRPDAVLDTVTSNRQTTSQDVEKDLMNSTTAAIGEMSPAELSEFMTEMMARPAMMKLNNVMPKITALRAKMEEEPLTPDEDARLQAAVTEVMTEIIGQPLGQ